MQHKEQRWYKIECDKAHIYNSPYQDYATSVSIVDLKDLQYYRNNFSLAKLWSYENDSQSNNDER